MMQENGPDLNWNDATQICNSCVNKGNVNFDLEMIYGCVGKQDVCIRWYMQSRFM